MSHLKRAFSHRISRIEVSAIKKMALRATEYKNVISFGWGVPVTQTHPEIRKAVVEALKTDPLIDRYSPVPGLPELRQKIADFWPKKYGFSISMQQVLITVGAMEGIMALIQVLADPGDEIAVMDPGFASHIEEMEVTGVMPRYVSLDESIGWGLHEETLRKAITPKTKALILINPNNPTGHIYTQKDLELIAQVVKENNLWLVLDEPYEAMVFDGAKLFHPLNIESIRENTIVIQSFSKKYSMTGWRVGYVVAQEEVIRQLMKVHDNTVVSAPRISQIAALRALDLPDSELAGELSDLHKRRDQMCSWFDRMPDLFSYVKPRGAYYIFPKIVANIDDQTLADRLLDEKQVVTTPGHAFGPTGKGHLRFCFSGEEKDIAEGMKRIEEWWGENKEKIEKK
ncbi:MAG: pyridoxal phosphate-dependent aminotransferase [Candidatus Gracilibacteria bacterium]